MPTIQLQDLQDRLYAKLDNNSALYPSSQLTAALNEALRVLNLFTGFLQTNINVSGNSVANQTFYNVPAGILIPLRVQFGPTYLQMYNLNEIGKAYRTWTADTTATVAMPVSYWVPFGLTQFAIYPADSVGGSAIRVTGVQEPVLLVNPTDTITVSNEIAEALDQLAFSTLTLKESGTVLRQSIDGYRAFQRQVQRVKLWQRFSMPSLTPPFTYQPEGRQAGRP